VIDADHAATILLGTFRLQDVEIGKCEPVMLVVVGEESKRRVLMLGSSRRTPFDTSATSGRKRRVR
jgi:hypothetical protein